MTNDRLTFLLVKCMDWIECDNCDTYDTFKHLKFKPEELEELGFGYLINDDEEEV